jgi:hypothetical protein
VLCHPRAHKIYAPVGMPLEPAGPVGAPLEPAGPVGAPLEPAGPVAAPLEPAGPIVPPCPRCPILVRMVMGRLEQYHTHSCILNGCNILPVDVSIGMRLYPYPY